MLILCINIQLKRYSLKGLRDSATSLVNVNTRCMDEAWNQSSHPHSNTFLFFLSVTRPQMNYLRWLWMGCQRDTRFLKLFQQTQAGGKLRMNPLHFWRAQCGECCLWMDGFRMWGICEKKTRDCMEQMKWLINCFAFFLRDVCIENAKLCTLTDLALIANTRSPSVPSALFFSHHALSANWASSEGDVHCCCFF